MKVEQIAERLETLLGHEINDWDREELAEKLSKMTDLERRVIMGYIGVIWPVSYALYLAFADRAQGALRCLGAEQFSRWVGELLDVYESAGLQKAVHFMDNVEEAFLCRIRGESGVVFAEAEKRLTPYICGVAGAEIRLMQAEEAWTALDTIYLPERFELLATDEQNFLLYKLTATMLAGFDLLGTFRLRSFPGNLNGIGEDGVSGYDHFFASFPEPPLARDIFYSLEAIRVARWAFASFPGLMRDCRPVLSQLHSLAGRKPQEPKGECVSFLQRQSIHILAGKPLDSCLRGATPLPECGRDLAQQSAEESAALTQKICAVLAGISGAYHPVPLLPFVGRPVFADAVSTVQQRRQAAKEHFVEALSQLIVSAKQKVQEANAQENHAGTKPLSEQGVLLHIEPMAESKTKTVDGEHENPPTVLTLGGDQGALPEEVARLAREIRDDFGAIPQEYIVSAYGRAGTGTADMTLETATAEDEALTGPLLYDEWDYRRAGFRKNWCRLLEKGVEPTRGTFLEATRRKYRGLIHNLRRQFEAMALQERFVRRQKDGNDIDLDAVVESLADQRAGQEPSERLFIRLQRSERDIAALFLVDMSNSTEGWVGGAMKESLILMCEALTVLGDRYAIYGFSGMRRSRCEFFTIKTFAESFDDAVKGKICAIAPKEYTRMGPAIRHAAGILDAMEAKIRLLITLSDGKPEDYDEYKGRYAIEDTRHALIEAKARGVHPFCITVDKESHDYLPHMYGEVNYVFIDDVGKLPARIPQIYRNLTT